MNMVQKYIGLFGFYINIHHIEHSTSIPMALLAIYKFYLPHPNFYFLLSWRIFTFIPFPSWIVSFFLPFVTWYPTLCV